MVENVLRYVDIMDYYHLLCFNIKAKSQYFFFFWGG